MTENSQNTVVRIHKNDGVSKDNHVVRKIKLNSKKNLVLKLKPRENPNLDDEECEEIISDESKKKIDNDSTQIKGSEIISEYNTITRKSISDEELSKEEMIDKVEYQRDILLKNRDKYSDKDYLLKISTIDKLLSKLREEVIQSNLNNMNHHRVQIDKIVLEKKMPVVQFKKKIDLTGDHDDQDPSMNVMTSSRKYFAKMAYLQIPSELAKLDPKKNKNFGNQPLPPDILNAINFS